MQSESPTLAPLVRKLSLHTHLDRDDEAAVLALPNTVRNLEPGQYVVRDELPPSEWSID